MPTSSPPIASPPILSAPTPPGPVPEIPLAPPAGSPAAYTDLFSALFEERATPPRTVGGVAPRGQGSGGRKLQKSFVSAPPLPSTLRETGLSLMQLTELVLKLLYVHGNLVGMQIARQTRLPFQVTAEALRFLKDDKSIEVLSGDLVGPSSYRFQLTDMGRKRAQEAFEQCRYVGPAPVTLESYVEQCRKQTVSGIDCTPESLLQAFSGLVIRDDLLQELGPAVCSGKSVFLYGPPGNGKTRIARGLGRFLNTQGGDIYVPYALLAENSIITIFDPTIHQATDAGDRMEEAALHWGAEGGGGPNPAGGGGSSWASPEFDLRWRRIRRPVVITGGELTLDMLDLRYHASSNFYTAPLHMKANGGVFLIDDFGRQIVGPRELLNRWILPLEDRYDFLTLATGKKLSIPFEQLILFSTNLDPRELVDEAFLRRIRHKIKIDSPSRDLFTEVFRLCCLERKIPYDAEAVEFLFSSYYDRGKPPRASDPRDLLEIVQAICRFRNEEVLLTQELMTEASKRFFCQL